MIDRTSELQDAANVSRIRSTLNIKELSQRFSTHQRLHCADFLEPSYAETLLKCLEEDVDWSTVLVEDKRVKELRSEIRKELDADAADLAGRAYESARTGFSFYFEANRRTSPGSCGPQRVRATLPSALQEFDTFLNSAESMALFRQLTSITAIARTDLMATRYAPGHFLTFHDDEMAMRKAAFVINLTANWKPAWGGLLQFLSPEGQIVDTFVPQFNSLHLFTVPQSHSVSFVAPFAQKTRYAISGWLYTAESQLPAADCCDAAHTSSSRNQPLADLHDTSDEMQI
jgi:SM-20-related protein